MSLRPLVLATLVLAACGQARPTDGTPRCTSWKEDIEPLFASRCASCHAGAAPAAGYDTSSYLGVLGGGRDRVPNAVAGDRSSRLLAMLDPAAAGSTHLRLDDDFEEVERWVVECEVSYVRSSIHPGGILDPASDQFHGRQVREAGWAFDTCKSCHGADFSGGTSGQSCKTCHAQGPTDCTACHSTLADKGAHRIHVEGGRLGKALDCSECHVKPTIYTDEGHLWRSDGSPDTAPAEVRFGPFAGRSLAHLMRQAPPRFDPRNGTCSNIYCHGGASRDTAATNPRPVWKDLAGSAACGSCHGLPPASHADATSRCATCHWNVVDEDREFVNLALHLDGSVQVGDGGLNCTSCHQQDTGAHPAHLAAPSRMSGPLSCSSCHAVPRSLLSPGHVDSALPAEVLSGACASCHGSANPVWTAPGTGQATCGTCHGIPPADGKHAPTITLFQCSTCHPLSVTSYGMPIIRAGLDGKPYSNHINGVVE